MSLQHRWGAYRELLSRYGAVWSHAWQHRSSMRAGLLNEQEAEFLPAALALQEKPLSRTARWTGRVLMLLVVVALLWSVLGHIDIVVNAAGKIIPSGHTKTMTSMDVAVVRALRVQEGQKVKAGDVLIVLDTSAPDAERDKAVGDSGAANLGVARSRALIAAIEQNATPRLPPVAGVVSAQWQTESSHLDGQYRDFKAKLTRIEGEIERFSQALPLATQRANDYKNLLKEHDVSEHAWQEKEQARIDLEGQLADARNQRAALITQTKKEAQDVVTDASKLAAASQQDAKRAGEHSKLLQLTSPVDGTVQQLNVHTVGAAVPAAQPLMLIVPQERQVEVEAFLENKDIGFVEEGQTVAVKIDAFEYTKYGTIPAKVTHVSRDAIQDDKKGLIYSVRITLDQPSMAIDGKTMPLSAGMSVNAEVKTGTRRVIEYVLSPLMQHQREALHER
jgi:hemolysin D